ncbi:TetR/AcrR family transcriptional regulator [Actinomadura sp. LCR2-06]|uniref:TetR/AcrR family transcriptional regulator n=2 Tax=Actinomadura violacea TaxID=2819934 RepID=A0ABS3RGX3_9ACTN|nr:TetR/AcrR family transcriptional regulator [Actinomadura violacea]
MEAGLELFGTAGYADTTIEALCERAGLTKRYFYESFTDREALLRAVYDAQIEPLKDRLITALSRPGMSIDEQIDTGVALFVDGLTADARTARIVFLESISSGPALRARADEVIHELSDLVLALLAEHLDGPAPRTDRMEYGALAIIGAVRQLINHWSTRQHSTDIDELTDVCKTLFKIVYKQFLLERHERSSTRRPG